MHIQINPHKEYYNSLKPKAIKPFATRLETLLQNSNLSPNKVMQLDVPPWTLKEADFVFDLHDTKMNVTNNKIYNHSLFREIKG